MATARVVGIDEFNALVTAFKQQGYNFYQRRAITVQQGTPFNDSYPLNMSPKHKAKPREHNTNLVDFFQCQGYTPDAHSGYLYNIRVAVFLCPYPDFKTKETTYPIYRRLKRKEFYDEGLVEKLGGEKEGLGW